MIWWKVFVNCHHTGNRNILENVECFLNHFNIGVSAIFHNTSVLRVFEGNFF
jgi:hypothetical protein